MREVRLQRLDPELLIRGIDNRAHGKRKSTGCGTLCQNVRKKRLELDGFNAPNKAMIRAVQRDHVFDDTIRVTLADAGLHHVEHHSVAQQPAHKDRGRVTARAELAKGRVNGPEQQPVRAAVNPERDAGGKRRVVPG